MTLNPHEFTERDAAQLRRERSDDLWERYAEPTQDYVRETLRMRYDAMLQGDVFCWACGRDAQDRHPQYHAPWVIQRAHLSAGSGRMTRIESREYVILLCPFCHLLHRHHPGEVKLFGEYYPALTDANCIWLKLHRDPEFYSSSLIAKAWIGNPPSPEAPHEWFLEEFISRRGMSL